MTVAYRLHLDLRVSEAKASSITYDPIAETTTFTLPIPVTATIQAVLRASSSDLPIGYQPVVLSVTPTTVTLKGNWGSPFQLYFGYTYASYFVPTETMYYGQDTKPVKAARLTLRRYRVDVASFGYLRALVHIRGRDTQVIEYQGIDLDNEDAPIDAPAQEETATLTVPLGGEAHQTRVTFINDTIYGMKVLGYEWEGNLFQKARRLT